MNIRVERLNEPSSAKFLEILAEHDMRQYTCCEMQNQEGTLDVCIMKNCTNLQVIVTTVPDTDHRLVHIFSALDAKLQLSIANHVHVTDLVSNCIRYLQQRMTINNCLQIDKFAKSHQVVELQKLTKKFILNNFQDISDFKN